jgi:hypothetical protein
MNARSLRPPAGNTPARLDIFVTEAGAAVAGRNLVAAGLMAVRRFIAARPPPICREDVPAGIVPNRYNDEALI